MTVRVAVDFGTSSTCVVTSVNGREPQVVVIDGLPLMSSAVYAAADGTLFVGQEAERQAAVDPSRYEPNPKRRIDEGELLLGDTVLRVTDVVHAVLGRVVAEARRIAGDAEVDLLVLTHPADWGAIRTRLLRQAAGRLANEVALVPEPVAAAVYHAATFAPVSQSDDRTVEFSGRPGEALAVLDLGGGTVDVSVVQRLPEASHDRTGRPRGGFQVLATRGDPSFGGADIDQALLEHIGSLVSATDPDAWRQLVEGRELTDRRRRRVLRQDVRGAKETLSRHTYTDVPMPPPFADAHVTREDLERLITAPLGRAVELTSAAIAEAGLRPKQLTAIFLVGGSSRIPMISRLVHERTGVVPTSLDQPETVVARGALRAVLVDPDRTGALPGSSIARLGRGEDARGERTEVVRPGEWPREGRSESEGRPELRPRPGGRPPSGPIPVPPPPARSAYGAQPPSVANPLPGGAAPALGKGPGGAAAPGGGHGGPGSAPGGGSGSAGSALGGGHGGAGSALGGGLGGAGSALGGGHGGAGSALGGGLGGAGSALGGGHGGAGSALGGGPGGAGSASGGRPALVGRPGGAGSALGSGPSSGPTAVRPGGAPSWAPSSGREGAEAHDRKRRSKLLWIGVLVVVVLLVAGLVVFLVTRPGDQSGPAPGRPYAQYDFSLVAPEDWVQTSDQVAQRQVILHPQESVAGDDLLVAQEYVMDYDATADRQRLIDALRAEAGSQEKYSGFDPGMTYGGRTVIGYHETKGDQLQVDWYVVVQGKFRVHVGCQYNVPALRQRVAAACDQVVRTLKITS